MRVPQAYRLIAEDLGQPKHARLPLQPLEHLQLALVGRAHTGHHVDSTTVANYPMQHVEVSTLSSEDAGLRQPHRSLAPGREQPLEHLQFAPAGRVLPPLLTDRAACKRHFVQYVES
uniref:Uncharacterized protein n=1 Tax=Strombidinopsis acuminata TaxID=141414 RepID=A0A7S3TD46_9SPIT